MSTHQPIITTTGPLKKIWVSRKQTKPLNSFFQKISVIQYITVQNLGLSRIELKTGSLEIPFVTKKY